VLLASKAQLNQKKAEIMATRNTAINDITKLAKAVAKRDLQAESADNNPELLSLIAAVTEQIKQRSGDNSQLNELVATIEASLHSSGKSDVDSGEAPDRKD
jgi:transcriptional regulator NrdR family protein